MTKTVTAPRSAEDLKESVRRHGESLATLSLLEAHIVAEIARLEDEIATLDESVSEAPTALVRHDIRQQIIDSQLILEGHRDELSKLRPQIEETKIARETAEEDLEVLRAEQ
jgi:hypothetical protein